MLDIFEDPHLCRSSQIMRKGQSLRRSNMSVKFFDYPLALKLTFSMITNVLCQSHDVSHKKSVWLVNLIKRTGYGKAGALTNKAFELHWLY